MTERLSRNAVVAVSRDLTCWRRLAVFGAAFLVVACGGDNVTEPQVAEVVVVPEEALIVGEGGGAQFSAFAHDASGNTVTATAEWSVDKPGVAEISDRGFATGRANGVTTVTATIGGVSGTAQLEVYVPRVVTDYEPGQHYYGRRDYVEYIPGELPVILSSAHGGDLVPEEIPDRSYGVLRNDLNSCSSRRCRPPGDDMSLDGLAHGEMSTWFRWIRRAVPRSVRRVPAWWYLRTTSTLTWEPSWWLP